jgi:integrase
MPRVSKGPSYERSKKRYVANLNGEKIPLLERVKKSPENDKIARDKYHQERAARSVEIDGDRALAWTVLNAYLNDCKNRVDPEPLAPNTLAMHLAAVNSFIAMFGEVKVRDLRRRHLNEWVEANVKPRWCEKQKRHYQWGPGQVRLNKEILLRAFKWAEDEEHISVSPFARKGKKGRHPGSDYCSKKVDIHADEHAAMLEQAGRRRKKDYQSLLNLLWATGARPAELYLATADEWDPKKRAFVIDPSDPRTVGRLKLRRKLKRTGRKRVVYVPPSLVPVVEEQMRQYPTGPLFRNEKKEAWTKRKIASRFGRMRQAVNKRAEREVVRKGVSLYSYRHAFVTRWLEQGGNAMNLCELINTSLDMLHKHYSHLFERHEVLSQALADFDSGAGQGLGTNPSRATA